jgi:putative methionine-R-sulfoxide reductase with GAF domain
MTKVFIITGSQKDQSFEVEDDTIHIGRAPDNDVQIMDSSVSRKHARILKKGERYFVEDLKSTNGTFFNGDLVNPGIEVEVKEGLPITVGKVLVSLGQPCSEGVVDAGDDAKLPPEFIDTGAFTVYVDRPRTTAKNLELIYKVSHVLMRSLDLTETFQKILDYLFELLKRIDRGAILLLHEETGEVKEVIARSKHDKTATTIDYSRAVVDLVVKEGKPVTVPDVNEQEEVDVSDSGELIQSVLCVPLISRSRIRGVLYVDSLDVTHGYREQDIELINALATPAAVAIENALLYSDLEKIAEEKTAMLRDSEKRCRACEARFKAVFENISSGVFFCEAVNEGKDFVILDLNQAAENIEEVKKIEILNKSVSESFPEIKDAGLMEVMKQVWESGKAERRTVTLREGEKAAAWRIYFISRLPTGEIMAIFDDVAEEQ